MVIDERDLPHPATAHVVPGRARATTIKMRASRTWPSMSGFVDLLAAPVQSNCANG